MSQISHHIQRHSNFDSPFLALLPAEEERVVRELEAEMNSAFQKTALYCTHCRDTQAERPLRESDLVEHFALQ